MINVATAVTSVSVHALQSNDRDTLKWMVEHVRRIRRELKEHQLQLIAKLRLAEQSVSQVDDLDSNLGEIRGSILLVLDLIRSATECIGFIERKLEKLEGANTPLGSTLPDPIRMALQPFLNPLPLAA